MAFPDGPRRAAGFQLGKIQAGLDPDDWKPFDDVGTGIREIRIRETSGINRVLYVTKFEKAVYVLHCFQKKTALGRPVGERKRGRPRAYNAAAEI
ncbi:MAG: type II toxin-antitoxin system RelE/ParE family toxin [Porticoccaceae bacterium]